MMDAGERLLLGTIARVLRGMIAGHDDPERKPMNPRRRADAEALDAAMRQFDKAEPAMRSATTARRR